MILKILPNNLSLLELKEHIEYYSEKLEKSQTENDIIHYLKIMNELRLEFFKRIQKYT